MNKTLKSIIWCVVLVLVFLGIEWFANWVMKCAYIRWMFVDGFFSGLWSIICWSVAQILLLSVIPIIYKIDEMGSSVFVIIDKTVRIVVFAGIVLVAVGACVAVWDSFTFCRMAWWKGIMNTLYSIFAALLGVGVFLSAIYHIVKGGQKMMELMKLKTARDSLEKDLSND